MVQLNLVQGSSLKSGCGLFVKEVLNLNLNQNEFQSCWIEVINDKTRQKVLIGAFFWHPSKKNSDGEFLKKLKDTLNKVKNINKHVVV